MEQSGPLTQTVKSSRARQEWSQIIDQVARRETRVVVERDGVLVAAIVSTDDLAHLQQLEEQRQRDLAILRASQDGFSGGSDSDAEREIEQALAEVRAERALANRSAPPPT
jgi:prevent-host-death family protein